MWLFKKVIEEITDVLLAVVSRGLVAVSLLIAAACGSNVDEVSDVLLARHVHTDFYDAYPGIPSPAGDRVVFADYAAGNRSLAVYDVATGVGRVVTRAPAGRSRVTWSPDGRWLAFHGHLEQSDDIWLVPVGGSERPTRLTRFGPGADTGEPDWSPDGRALAVTMREAAIEVVALATGNRPVRPGRP